MATGFQAPPSLRYVLLYSVTSLPEGFALIPDSMTSLIGPAQSWTEYYNACDPYLSHIVYLECPTCNNSTRELTLMASNSAVDKEDPANKNHMVIRCVEGCINTRTKIRILRRACVPIIAGQPSAMLEVEVIGNMRIRENVFEGNHRFELFAVDIEGNRFKAVKYQPQADGRWDMEVDGNRGHIKGFEGHWEMVDWYNASYDLYGLCGIDRHSAKLEGWPPVEWFIDDDVKEVEVSQGVEAGEEVNQGVEVSQGVEVNQGVEAGEEVNQGVEAGEQENLVQVIGGDQWIDGHEEYQGYDASDAESAA